MIFFASGFLYFLFAIHKIYLILRKKTPAKPNRASSNIPVIRKSLIFGEVIVLTKRLENETNNQK